MRPGRPCRASRRWNSLPSPIRLLLIGLFVLLLPMESPAGGDKWWVFLKDKGLRTTSQRDSALALAETHLTTRGKVRRERLGNAKLVDDFDLPVFSGYVEQIKETAGVSLRRASRWLNAVSIQSDAAGVRALRRLSFVLRVVPLGSRRHPPLFPPASGGGDAPFLPQPRRDHNLDYGNSLRQNAFLNVPELHDRGYLGEGVLVGLCDAGFDNLDHESFAELDVAATWDFVNDDEDVADGDDMGEGQHGTRTLSIVAGYAPGRLIGTAPHASYVLAKTENSEWERPVEEDAWVAAVEWMDSLGVEVISSSLGYSDWYDYEDMDGRTAVTTIAADRAVEVGIVVLNAIGNLGMNRYPNDKMGAPADGFDVLSIGATNRDSSLAGFSSHGPTYDGRIKPDFVTFGSSVIFASSVNDDGYGAGAGTSFSTPALAGLCALLIETDPYITPGALRAILRDAADNRDEPDTLYGWGIPDGLAAFEAARPDPVRLPILLHQGWNTVSMNLARHPFADIRAVFADMVARRHLRLVKDGQGRFYAPDIPFNNIPFWNRFEGYQVHALADDSLVFEGDLAVYTEPVALREGWQIVAYLPNFELPPRSALTSLTADGALYIIKDEWGRFYLPAFDFSNLPALEPGRGYHIKLNRDAVLRYPRQRLAEWVMQASAAPVHFRLPQPQGEGMSILLIGDDGIADGDEAAFRDPSGVTAGAGIFSEGKCGIALWGETPSPLSELVLWRQARQLEVTPTTQLLAGETSYAPGGVAFFSVSAPTPIKTDLYVTASPTPFNSSLTISVRAPTTGRGKVTLFDVAGRRVAERAIVLAGDGKGVLRLDDLSLESGVYFVRVEASGRSISVRAVSLK